MKPYAVLHKRNAWDEDLDRDADKTRARMAAARDIAADVEEHLDAKDEPPVDCDYCDDGERECPFCDGLDADTPGLWCEAPPLRFADVARAA